VNSRNLSGKPLCSAEWLEAHHRAKLPERRAFAESLVSRSPKRVVDLGCGTGLWLSLFHELLPPDCEFIGLDSDSDSLLRAQERAHGWNRRTRFDQIDLGVEADAVPEGDVTLSFNIFPYLADPGVLLSRLARRGGTVAVRQYDGGALRFGPMDTEVRALVESSLRASVFGSEEFRHYDLDRVVELLSSAPFHRSEITFELFTRTAPFPQEFLAYYQGTLDWTMELVSEDARRALMAWLKEVQSHSCYFFEVDLTAILS
jgi:SAM-dependent methyltransferase